jgi:hypothetical protein
MGHTATCGLSSTEPPRDLDPSSISVPSPDTGAIMGELAVKHRNLSISDVLIGPIAIVPEIGSSRDIHDMEVKRN